MKNSRRSGWWRNIYVWVIGVGFFAVTFPHLSTATAKAAESVEEKTALAEAAKLNTEGVALFNAAKYVEAETLCRSLLLTHPQDAELHHQLGRALLKQRKFSQAEQEFLAAVKLKPDWGLAYGDLAVAANEAQHYPLAIQALDTRAKYLPEIPVGYFLRATAYDHLRDYHQAAANYHLFLQVADGKYPDQEWQARHRLITIEPKK